MRIVRMYSGTMAGSQDWKKIEVEVDENDLASILNEAEIVIDRNKLTTRQAFALLTYEAEILLFTSMVHAFKTPPEEVAEDVARLRSAKSDVLAAVRKNTESVDAS